MSEYRRIGLLAAGLALLPIPVVLLQSSHYARVLNLFVLFALLAVALNVVFGHTDQLFLFVGGLAGVGAYTTALAADALGVTPWVTIPAGVLLCGALGALVSWVSAKRRFTVILIAILTLNLQLALVQFFVGARDLTGGSTGFPFVGLGLEGVGDAVGVDRNVVLFYLLVVVLAGVLASYVRLVNSKYGLAFEAIREDELAAESVGVDVVRYKTIAGFLAAALVGGTGVMYLQFEQYVTPSLFTFLAVDVVVLIMLIVGGLRTTFGPVLGSAVVIIIEEVLRNASQWRTAIFGALLILLFLYFRRGVVPEFRDRFASRDDAGEGGGGTPAGGEGDAVADPD